MEGMRQESATVGLEKKNQEDPSPLLFPGGMKRGAKAFSSPGTS